MIYTATITSKNNAKRIRQQLHNAGFTYMPSLKTWVLNCITIRGARLNLDRVRSIEGIRWQRHTLDEWRQNN